MLWFQEQKERPIQQQQPQERNNNEDKSRQEHDDEPEEDDHDDSGSATTMGDTVSVDLLLGFSQQQQTQQQTESHQSFFHNETINNYRMSDMILDKGDQQHDMQQLQDEDEKNIRGTKQHKMKNTKNERQLNDLVPKHHPKIRDHFQNDDDGDHSILGEDSMKETRATSCSPSNIQDLMFDMSQLSQIPLGKTVNYKEGTVDDDKNDNDDNENQHNMNHDDRRSYSIVSQSQSVHYHFIALRLKREFGMHVRRLGNGDIIVSDLKVKSQAEQYGLKVGDVIYRAPPTCQNEVDWRRLMKENHNGQIKLERYSIEEIANLSKSMVRPVFLVIERGRREVDAGMTGASTANATTTTRHTVTHDTTTIVVSEKDGPREEAQHQSEQTAGNRVTCSMSKKDLRKALADMDQKGHSDRVKVPCCRLCCRHGKRTSLLMASAQRHHFLCPKHHNFSDSGAKEKLVILLAGALYECDACTYELEHGKKHCDMQHNAKCRASSSSSSSFQLQGKSQKHLPMKKKENGTKLLELKRKKSNMTQVRLDVLEEAKVAHDRNNVTSKRQKTRASIQHDGNHDIGDLAISRDNVVTDGGIGKNKRSSNDQSKGTQSNYDDCGRSDCDDNDDDEEMELDVSRTVQKRRKRLSSTPSNALGTEQTQPERIENVISPPQKPYEVEKTDAIQKENVILYPPVKKGTSHPAKKKQGTTVQIGRNKNFTSIDHSASRSKDKIDFPPQHSSRKAGVVTELDENEKNSVHVTPVPDEEPHRLDIDTARETTEGLSIILTDDASVSKWVPCPNPWGDRGYRDGDFVLCSPTDYLTAIETYGVHPNRFTMYPFTGNHYQNTHVPPTEKGLDFIQLNRDRLALRSWGFRYCYHDFGGACLVTDVEPMSPADSGTLVGIEGEETRLYPNDMIIFVNSKKVGGMTELELGIELDLSGSELVLAISRYRRNNIDQRNICADRKKLTSAEVSSLHWNDIGLEKDVRYSARNIQSQYETSETGLEEDVRYSPKNIQSRKETLDNPVEALDIQGHNETLDNRAEFLDIKTPKHSSKSGSTTQKGFQTSNSERYEAAHSTAKEANEEVVVTNHGYEIESIGQSVGEETHYGCQQRSGVKGSNEFSSDGGMNTEIHKLQFKDIPDTIFPITSTRNRHGYKGVELRPHKVGLHGKYYAYFSSKEGRVVYGPFHDPIDAAKMYAWAYLLYHGEESYNQLIRTEGKGMPKGVETRHTDRCGKYDVVKQTLQSLDIKHLPSHIEPIQSSSGKSGYKGVHMQNNKFHATLYCGNSRIKIGSYDDKVDAARMYAWAYNIVHSQVSLKDAQSKDVIERKNHSTAVGADVNVHKPSETNDQNIEGQDQPTLNKLPGIEVDTPPIGNDSNRVPDQPTFTMTSDMDHTLEKKIDDDKQGRGQPTVAEKLSDGRNTQTLPTLDAQSVQSIGSEENKVHSFSSSCTENTDVEWDNDSNPWLGCVCGETHQKPVTVFWIQCDSCDAWYNCSPNCIGFTKDEAEMIDDWKCPDCLLPDNGFDCHVNDVMSTPFKSTSDSGTVRSATISVGSIVNVIDRTWIGCNKPGGVAKVVDVHIDGHGNVTYDVKYVLENRTEKNVESEYVSVNISMMDHIQSPSTRRTRVSASKHTVESPSNSQ